MVFKCVPNLFLVWLFFVTKKQIDRLMSTKKIFEKSSFESAAPPLMPGSEAFLDAQEAPEDTEGAPGWADEAPGVWLLLL